MRAAIFDLDGTLAENGYRLHHVTGGKRDWDAFFAAVEDDAVVGPIRDLLFTVSHDYAIIICSGRTASCREATERWLTNNGIGYSELYMRAVGDFRPDHTVKAEMLLAMRDDGYDPWLVVDDRPSVVAMWREQGLTCLQCRATEEFAPTKGALLTIMVGPTGAGKSTWLDWSGHRYGIRPDQVLSSDGIRLELCGDELDQSRNDEVFAALHAVVRARISHGLPTTVDATNIRTKDRKAVAALAGGGPVRYVVIDRPMAEKYRDAYWRANLKDKDGKPFDLIAKHAQTFASNLKDILAGDGLPNVTVVDLRRTA